MRVPAVEVSMAQDDHPDRIIGRNPSGQLGDVGLEAFARAEAASAREPWAVAGLALGPKANEHVRAWRNRVARWSCLVDLLDGPSVESAVLVVPRQPAEEKRPSRADPRSGAARLGLARPAARQRESDQRKE